jgi:hypothetical protein
LLDSDPEDVVLRDLPGRRELVQRRVLALLRIHCRCSFIPPDEIR